MPVFSIEDEDNDSAPYIQNILKQHGKDIFDNRFKTGFPAFDAALRMATVLPRDSGNNVIELSIPEALACYDGRERLGVVLDAAFSSPSGCSGSKCR